MAGQYAKQATNNNIVPMSYAEASIREIRLRAELRRVCLSDNMCDYDREDLLERLADAQNDVFEALNPKAA